jgi:hypothetical protein
MRIYTPAWARPFPLILFIDGGGWVVATIDTCDASARALTHAAQAMPVFPGLCGALSQRSALQKAEARDRCRARSDRLGLA